MALRACFGDCGWVVCRHGVVPSCDVPHASKLIDDTWRMNIPVSEKNLLGLSLAKEISGS
jgi:hypothetical protein